MVPLTVHDIERLDRGPDTVVLAACEAGHDVVLAGDEMLGLSASFLARETRHVVASVVPIPDAATTPVMERLHRLLSRGTQVAVALAQAQQQVDPHDPACLCRRRWFRLLWCWIHQSGAAPKGSGLGACGQPRTGAAYWVRDFNERAVRQGRSARLPALTSQPAAGHNPLTPVASKPIFIPYRR